MLLLFNIPAALPPFQPRQLHHTTPIANWAMTALLPTHNQQCKGLFLILTLHRNSYLWVAAGELKGMCYSCAVMPLHTMVCLKRFTENGLRYTQWPCVWHKSQCYGVSLHQGLSRRVQRPLALATSSQPALGSKLHGNDHWFTPV